MSRRRQRGVLCDVATAALAVRRHATEVHGAAVGGLGLVAATFPVACKKIMRAED